MTFVFAELRLVKINSRREILKRELVFMGILVKKIRWNNSIIIVIDFFNKKEYFLSAFSYNID